MKRIFILILLFYVYSFQTKVYSQEESNLKFGISYSLFYNHKKVMHHLPNFSININKHNIYIGALFTRVLKGMYDPAILYRKDAYGGCLGYRYLFKRENKKTTPFLQLNSAIYQIEYTVSQHGPPFLTEHKKIIVENTISIGVNFNPVKHIHIYSGIGFGIYNNSILSKNNITPSIFTGFTYMF